jgi:hypothetical protein
MIVRENSEFSMNVNSTISSEILTNIIYFINKLNTKNVILVCRSSNEPFADEHPTQTHLDLIKNQTDKNIIIFYQDPWPEPVPSFIEMDTTVIRFGFDEGCELDKKCIDPNFSIVMEDGEYNFLVNKNNSINLNNKKSII